MLVLKFNLRNGELGIPIQSIKSNYPLIINPRDTAAHRSNFLKLKFQMHFNVNVHSRICSHTLLFVKNQKWKAKTWTNVRNIRIIIHIPQFFLKFLLSHEMENGSRLKVTKAFDDSKLWSSPGARFSASLPREASRSSRPGGYSLGWARKGECPVRPRPSLALRVLLVNVMGGWPCPLCCWTKDCLLRNSRDETDKDRSCVCCSSKPWGQHPIDRGVLREAPGKGGRRASWMKTPCSQERGWEEEIASSTHIDTSFMEERHMGGDTAWQNR